MLCIPHLGTASSAGTEVVPGYWPAELFMIGGWEIRGNWVRNPWSQNDGYFAPGSKAELTAWAESSGASDRGVLLESSWVSCLSHRLSQSLLL